MRDGIYTVELKVGGGLVVARAEVRDGVFRGLGSLAGVVGVLSGSGQRLRSTATSAASAAPDSGTAGDARWRRADIAENAKTSSPCLADRWQMVRDTLEDLRRQIDALSSASRAQRRSAEEAVVHRTAIQDVTRELIDRFDVARDAFGDACAARPKLTERTTREVA